jgi:hypothetical protein
MTGGDEEANESNKQPLATGKPVCELNLKRRCHQEIDRDRQGVQSCVQDGGNRAWTACTPDVSAPSAKECASIKTGFGKSFWNGECCVNEYGCCPGDECNTPLVIAFDDEPVRYDSSSCTNTFNLSAHGMSQQSDWPTSKTPWLALDRDGNGRIDGGHELFGSATELSVGGFASNGFAALAELDGNRDGRIDARDAVWSRLVLWRDANGDRVSDSIELQQVHASGLAFIDLGYRIAPRCDGRGNCEVERAEVGIVDGSGARTGSVIDIRLAVR